MLSRPPLYFIVLLFCPPLPPTEQTRVDRRSLQALNNPPAFLSPKAHYTAVPPRRLAASPSKWPPHALPAYGAGPTLGHNHNHNHGTLLLILLTIPSCSLLLYATSKQSRQSSPSPSLRLATLCASAVRPPSYHHLPPPPPPPQRQHRSPHDMSLCSRLCPSQKITLPFTSHHSSSIAIVINNINFNFFIIIIIIIRATARAAGAASTRPRLPPPAPIGDATQP